VNEEFYQIIALCNISKRVVAPADKS